MSHDKDRFWPRSFGLEPLERDPVTILNEPPLPDNVSVMVPKARSLHAVLCEARTNTQRLLARLEAGVCVPKTEHREVVRELYVQARRQVKALAAVLELDGLE